MRGRLVDAAARLRDAADAFVPGGRVTHAYDPLRYAWGPHRAFLERYGGVAPRRVVLVGMNPGPWGMGQTGVPFGDPALVREWLRVEGRVEQPARPHPKRPVLGFASTRRDGSGRNLWGWARERCGAPERFFAEFHVTNYCPLMFFDGAGRNVTPPELPRARTEALDAACDAHLLEVVRALRPSFLVGLGRFAEERLRDLAAREGLDAQVRGVLHPSPAHPANNHGWRPDFSFLDGPPGI